MSFNLPHKIYNQCANHDNVTVIHFQQNAILAPLHGARSTILLSLRQNTDARVIDRTSLRRNFGARIINRTSLHQEIGARIGLLNLLNLYQSSLIRHPCSEKSEQG